MFSVEVWFPQREAAGDLKLYELLPGVGFYGSARDGGVAPEGPLPWVIVSHGHMGTRLVYSQLCESLAALGYVVMALEHPGDTLFDVVSGTGVDEETNIALRLGDLETLYRQAIGEDDGFPHGISLDLSNLTLLGHSFGAYSVMSWAGTETGRAAARSVVCLQPYFVRLTPDGVHRGGIPRRDHARSDQRGAGPPTSLSASHGVGVRGRRSPGLFRCCVVHRSGANHSGSPRLCFGIPQHDVGRHHRNSWRAMAPRSRCTH